MFFSRKMYKESNAFSVCVTISLYFSDLVKKRPS